MYSMCIFSLAVHNIVDTITWVTQDPLLNFLIKKKKRDYIQ